MRKITIVIVPDDARTTTKWQIPFVFVKLFTVFAFVSMSLLGYFAHDYLELRQLRQIADKLETENAGLKGEARILMVNLGHVKEALKKVETYMTKLGEITRLRVEQVSEKTGIGPLTPEDYSASLAMRSATEAPSSKSLIPFGLDADRLVFQPIINRLSEVKEVAGNQGIELQQLLSTLSERRSLLNSIPSATPVDGWITSGFGKRISPFSGTPDHHRGIDVAAPLGTPVLAPAHGVVIYSGPKEGFGNFIEIAHGYGIVSRYGHNAQNLVQPGQKVKRGEQIATVGMTGRTTGPHLHYEIWVNGSPSDPKRFILDMDP